MKLIKQTPRRVLGVAAAAARPTVLGAALFALIVTVPIAVVTWLIDLLLL